MDCAAAPPIVVGRVRKPHGLKGELAVFPLTDDPQGIFARGREVLVLDLGGEVQGQLTIAEARVYHRECLIRFAGHDDRDSVDGLRGRFLGVSRYQVAPLADGEVYQQELVGWSVRSETDESLGLVNAVYELPQGLTIEVQGPEREFMLPYRAEYVNTMDREHRRLVVTVPEGLLE